ncbi:hypothetical protein K9I53_02215 [Klebsiella quasipneumoniae]|jgi:hypothetical protein|uniref:hypothetical protein n=1 Tax=Klebsiella TaxID=570 RepID=UPI000E2B67B1|nr:MULTISPECIES: hypothetical protein [Klebsiella]MDU1520328.1 hypothetical protein [Klebsiella michiganensis]DAQ65655.1 MAG TPA: hypothetical protein [Caudoviricetes sp.]MBD7349805.1 hypothetical protein [Klebsiella pneumoniae]MBE0214001.1 hypothetical protein [Klebsiella pneumoniae]MCQ0776141.1 hypothetical protein [Klebsiella pneumoniae]
MPITIQEIKEHHDQFGLHDMSATPTAEYRQALKDGALFWIDHHDFVRSTLSGEIFATNREQLDAMIEHLQEYRNKMSTPPDWMSEK